MDDTQPVPGDTTPTDDESVADDLQVLAEADPGDAPGIAERLADALGEALDRERIDAPPR